MGLNPKMYQFKPVLVHLRHPLNRLFQLYSYYVIVAASHPLQQLFSIPIIINPCLQAGAERDWCPHPAL